MAGVSHEFDPLSYEMLVVLYERPVKSHETDAASDNDLRRNSSMRDDSQGRAILGPFIAAS